MRRPASALERWGGRGAAAAGSVGRRSAGLQTPTMNFAVVLVVAAALAGQLRASAPLERPAQGGSPVLQDRDGYLQTIKDAGEQPKGWASLRRAFHSRDVSVSCPATQASAAGPQGRCTNTAGCWVSGLEGEWRCAPGPTAAPAAQPIPLCTHRVCTLQRRYIPALPASATAQAAACSRF